MLGRATQTTVEMVFLSRWTQTPARSLLLIRSLLVADNDVTSDDDLKRVLRQWATDLAWAPEDNGRVFEGPRGELIKQLKAIGPRGIPKAEQLLASYDAERAAKAEAGAELRQARAQRRLIRLQKNDAELAALEARGRRDPFGTKAGLRGSARTRAAHRPEIARDPGFLGGLGPDGWRGVRRTLPEKTPWAAREDHLRIDINVLKAEGLLRPGKLTLVDLLWPDSPFDIRAACLAIDMREPEHEIRIATEGEEGPRLYPVGLRWRDIGGRQRPSMVCQMDGGEVEVLAYRFGYFGEPRFLRLTQRSQLKPRTRVRAKRRSRAKNPT